MSAIAILTLRCHPPDSLKASLPFTLSNPKISNKYFLVSIISSISFDHIDILGSSLKEIAYQKAGIIKEDSNTIIFSPW